MPDTGPTVGELSVMLADDIERVAEALNLDVRRRTPRKLICASPFSPDKLKLEVEISARRGKWNDWSHGRYGDALGLVAYALGFPDPKAKDGLRQAILWAKGYFGLDVAGFDAEGWRVRREAAERRAKEREAKARRELSAHRKTALHTWLQGAALAPGDVAWQYFAARGIDLQLLGRIPGAIRVAAASPWHDDDGEVQHVGPAILSMMQLPTGDFGCLHRIWIDPARPGEKADLPQPRKMWPSSEACSIPVWRGETKLSDKDALKQGVVEDLVVCEGVEDGLSIAIMTPELRVKAAGSLGGLLSFVPPKHVRKVIVAADNDWGKPQCADQLRRACLRLRDDFGKAVAIARSPTGKDFNDQLRGE